jgi:hypothetical protein
MTEHIELCLMIEKIVNSRLSVIIAILVTCYIAYYMLLRDNYLHSSISSIISYSHHLAIREHLLILGLLPIYIAFMIFGAAVIGVYLGASIQTLLSRVSKKY